MGSKRVREHEVTSWRELGCEFVAPNVRELSAEQIGGLILPPYPRFGGAQSIANNDIVRYDQEQRSVQTSLNSS